MDGLCPFLLGRGRKSSIANFKWEIAIKMISSASWNLIFYLHIWKYFDSLKRAHHWQIKGMNLFKQLSSLDHKTKAFSLQKPHDHLTEQGQYPDPRSHDAATHLQIHRFGWSTQDGILTPFTCRCSHQLKNIRKIFLWNMVLALQGSEQNIFCTRQKKRAKVTKVYKNWIEKVQW